MNWLLEKVFKFLASLQLAVIVILGIGIISAWGTFVEAKYDAQYAQKLIYHSPLMYFILALLCINLLSVMIDRLPWKRHHTGFLLAHIGIITLIVGSIMTRYYGIDGSLSIDIDKSNRYVMLNETEVAVYASFANDGYRRLAYTDRDFLVHPLEKPMMLPIGQREFKIVEYIHYALRDERIIESQSDLAVPAVRMNLQNPNVNMTEWIMSEKGEADSRLELGPATIILTKTQPSYNNANEVYLRALGPDSKKIEYSVFTKSQGGLTSKGQVEAGGIIDLGWMGLKLRVLRFFPSAERKVTYSDNKTPTSRTRPALLIKFADKEHWLSLNSNARIFDDNTAYLVAFNNKRINLGFDIHLDKFTVGRYQGTMRAASYASDITIPGELKYHISMNDPLKYAGYTFYQASFQEDDAGNATTSILSVNRDPGRWVKYLGSFLIVLGSLVMFYFKRMKIKSLIKKNP